MLQEVNILREPRWTVVAGLRTNGTRWIGQSHEFFDDEGAADRRRSVLSALGHCPTKRPYHGPTDCQYLHLTQKRDVGPIRPRDLVSRLREIALSPPESIDPMDPENCPMPLTAAEALEIAVEIERLRKFERA